MAERGRPRKKRQPAGRISSREDRADEGTIHAIREEVSRQIRANRARDSVTEERLIGIIRSELSRQLGANRAAPELLTPRELAALCRVSVKTVERWKRRGLLSRETGLVRLGGQLRVDRHIFFARFPDAQLDLFSAGAARISKNSEREPNSAQLNAQEMRRSAKLAAQIDAVALWPPRPGHISEYEWRKKRIEQILDSEARRDDAALNGTAAKENIVDLRAGVEALIEKSERRQKPSQLAGCARSKYSRPGRSGGPRT